MKLQKKKIQTDFAHFPRPGENDPYVTKVNIAVLVWSYPLVLYPTAVWEWFWQVWAQLHKLGEWGNTPSGVGRRGKGGLTLSVGSLVVCQSTLPLSLHALTFPQWAGVTLLWVRNFCQAINLGSSLSSHSCLENLISEILMKILQKKDHQ